MENCRRRQSSSVSVLLPTVSAQPKRKRGGRRLSAAGIDSWQRVVRPRYSYHLHDSKHLARSPSLGTGRWRFFQLLDGSRGRSVFIQLDENLALFARLSHHKSNRLSWLEGWSKEDGASALEITCKMGVFWKSVMLRICRSL